MAKIFILFLCGDRISFKTCIVYYTTDEFCSLQVHGETSLRNLCMSGMQLHPLSSYLFLHCSYTLLNVSLHLPLWICSVPFVLSCFMYSSLKLVPLPIKTFWLFFSPCYNIEHCRCVVCLCYLWSFIMASSTEWVYGLRHRRVDLYRAVRGVM